MLNIDQLDQKKVLTQSKDYSLKTLKELYDDGDLITNPDYQREFVYTDKESSSLIESLLLGIPIPTVYLCEENDETYSVIDGQQRITSFVKYLKNEFALTGLKVLRDLNGKLFKELDEPFQKKLKNSTIHAICLCKESQELKYEIFARLNLGSKHLNSQEIRNCIYRGSFNNMLNDLAKNTKNLPELFSKSKSENNNRKAYQERILRFFALRDYANYGSSISKTLNTYMSKHQNDTDEELKKMKDLFKGTIDIIKQVLGENAFSAVSVDSKTYINKFSPSVYDSIMISFSYFDKNSLMRHSDEIRTKVDNIRKNNMEYRGYSEKSTASKSCVIGRIQIIFDAIYSCMTDDDMNGSKRLFSLETKQQLWHKGYICPYCHNEILSIDDAEVDHIIAFSKGGETTIDNAQLLHKYCNRVKSANDEDWDDEDLDGEED